MSDRARNLVIFGLEVALVIGYILVFGIFVTQSDDFLVVRNNSRATAAAAALPAELPARFEFGWEKAGNDLLGAGWHRPIETDTGAWTKMPAYVVAPVVSGAGGVTLLLEGEAYVAPGHETVSITLWVDGAEVGQWAARYGQPAPRLSVSVPLSATADGLLEIRIDAVPLAVPYHYDRSEEKRNVGFLLRALSLGDLAVGDADLE